MRWTDQVNLVQVKIVDENSGRVLIGMHAYPDEAGDEHSTFFDPIISFISSNLQNGRG